MDWLHRIILQAGLEGGRMYLHVKSHSSFLSVKDLHTCVWVSSVGSRNLSWALDMFSFAFELLCSWSLAIFVPPSTWEMLILWLSRNTFWKTRGVGKFPDVKIGLVLGVHFFASAAPGKPSVGGKNAIYLRYFVFSRQVARTALLGQITHLMHHKLRDLGQPSGTCGSIPFEECFKKWIRLLWEFRSL